MPQPSCVAIYGGLFVLNMLAVISRYNTYHAKLHFRSELLDANGIQSVSFDDQAKDPMSTKASADGAKRWCRRQRARRGGVIPKGGRREASGHLHQCSYVSRWGGMGGHCRNNGGEGRACLVIGLLNQSTEKNLPLFMRTGHAARCLCEAPWG